MNEDNPPQPSVRGNRLFRVARDVIAYSTETGDCIPDNIIVDKVLIMIMKSQAYKAVYLTLKTLPPGNQDFAHVQTHFRTAERLCKKCQDTAQDYGYSSLSTEEAAQDGMTKNMLDLANAMYRNDQNETVNAGREMANVTIAALEEIRDGMVQMQLQMNQLIFATDL